MKKRTLLALLTATCILTGCGQRPEVTDDVIDETTQTEETSATPTPRPTATPTPRPTAAPTATPAPTAAPTQAPLNLIEFPDDLDLVPTYSDEEMYGDSGFLEVLGTNTSQVTAEEYPELKASLDSLEREEYDTACIRRADSKVFSFLNIGSSGLASYNFDSATGERLMLEDVFSDTDSLCEMLGVPYEAALTGSSCAFVIEPSGVTFVFQRDSNDYEYQTVLYKGNEDIFAADDIFDMTTYAIEFREYWGSTFEYTVDIGNDGEADTISCTVDWEEGLAVSVNGNENNVIDDMAGYYTVHPKFICVDGDCYLMCFLMSDGGWGRTYILELEGDSVSSIGSTLGEIGGAPIEIPNTNEAFPFESFMHSCVLTDPTHMYVCRITNLFGTYYTYYPISLDSFPDTEREFGIGCGWRMLTSLCDIEAEDLETGASVILPEGTELRIALVDEPAGTVVLQDISDGTCYVITVDDPEVWNRTVNGVDEYSLFSGIYYSG